LANEGVKFVGGLILVVLGFMVLFVVWAFSIPIQLASSFFIQAVILFGIGGYLFYKGAIQEKTIQK
jgi:hypothetical protein